MCMPKTKSLNGRKTPSTGKCFQYSKHTASSAAVWSATFWNGFPKKKTWGSLWTTTRRQASNGPLLQRPTASPGLHCAERYQHIMGGDPSALPRARETHGQLHIQCCALQYNKDRDIWFCSKETALKSVAYSLVIGLSGGQHQNTKLKVGDLFFLG